ncbi:hypothetical protein [Aneurinibacillus tyrosinisolvens]|uniref:hypothetical protein n=1 Tax=Aneurinibacillus tyrosinisolvens TaxID=1443435 RepID=UPI000B2C77FB|nr:hypothetical protein [Aneurinibacillus tyrosinisolvens]
MVQTGTQSMGNIVDFMWDGWIDGMKMTYERQNEMENRTLQTMEYHENGTRNKEAS